MTQKDDFTSVYRSLERSGVPISHIVLQVENHLKGLNNLPNDTPDIGAARLQLVNYLSELKEEIEPTTQKTSSGGFFNPPELETLYALTQLSGKQCLRALGISEIHYQSLAHANGWATDVTTRLHSCYVSGSPMFEIWGQKAYDKLFEIWSLMTDKGIEEYPYPATVSWYERPVSAEARMLSLVESMADKLDSGNSAEQVREMWEQEYPTIQREGPFAEYFRMTYGGAPSRVLITGDRTQSRMALTALSNEFCEAQTGCSGRGSSFFILEPKYNAQAGWKLETQYINGEPYYIQVIPRVEELLNYAVLDDGRLTRRLIVVDLFDSISPNNDATFITNFFNKHPHQPILLVLLGSEEIFIDGPVLHY